MDCVRRPYFYQTQKEEVTRAIAKITLFQQNPEQLPHAVTEEMGSPSNR